jgi:hypothetical protein
LSVEDYAYAPENIPEIRVLGETAFWNAELEETPDDDDAALLAGPEADDDDPDTRDAAAIDGRDTVDEANDPDEYEDVR